MFFLLNDSPALNFMCRRFETLFQFHLHRWCNLTPLMKMKQSVPKRRHMKFRCRGITQKKQYNIQNTSKVWNQKFFKLLFKFPFEYKFLSFSLDVQEFLVFSAADMSSEVYCSSRPTLDTRCSDTKPTFHCWITSSAFVLDRCDSLADNCVKFIVVLLWHDASTCNLLPTLAPRFHTKRIELILILNDIDNDNYWKVVKNVAAYLCYRY